MQNLVCLGVGTKTEMIRIPDNLLQGKLLELAYLTVEQFEVFWSPFKFCKNTDIIVQLALAIMDI